MLEICKQFIRNLLFLQNYLHFCKLFVSKFAYFLDTLIKLIDEKY